MKRSKFYTFHGPLSINAEPELEELEYFEQKLDFSTLKESNRM